MSETIALSEAALSLLRGYRGDIAVTDSNRKACRELAAAGLLVVGHTFTGGREVFYRMTWPGVEMLENDEEGVIACVDGCGSVVTRIVEP